MSNAQHDQNHVPSLLGVSSVDGSTIVPIYANPTTHRLLVDIPSGSGTVTSVSVVTANGFAGSVANATSTPAITLSTTITGVLKGDGTAISAASAGTDYVAPGAITTSGLTQSTARLLGRTTAATGAVEEISVGTGLSLSAGSLTSTALTTLTVGSTTITSGTTTRILYDNAGVLGEYSVIPVSLGGTNATSASITAFNNITGYTASGATGTTSTNLVFSTSPTLTTPVLGVATATSINKVTITAPASSATLTIPDGVTLTGPASSGTAATLGNAETFTGAKTFTKTIQTVTAMAAQALDGSLGNVFTRTLAASETFTQSNFSTGQCFIVEVKQGSGTTYTVTWFSGITWVTSGATAPTQTTTTNGYTTYGFRCTGANTFLGYLVGTQ